MQELFLNIFLKEGVSLGTMPKTGLPGLAKRPAARYTESRQGNVSKHRPAGVRGRAGRIPGSGAGPVPREMDKEAP